MSLKRKFDDKNNEGEKIQKITHTLDSDEEDDDDESEKYQLQEDDIEGAEDGGVGNDEGIQITPFNMKEEMEEGHFDKDGMYHWKKEKLAKDHWLDNIDWVKIKQSEKDSNQKSGDSDNDDEMNELVNIIDLYKEVITFMLPKETVTRTLKRLGGNTSLSASERLKLKKAGLLEKKLKEISEGCEKVTLLTELSNKILTQSGNMDIYQETYEFIYDKINACTSKTKEPELDMYADDFDIKEREKLSDKQINSNAGSNIESLTTSDDVMWEYKEKNKEKINGPYTTVQMDKWSKSGHFGDGVLVRKCGSDDFYTSNRMDFELYL